MIFKKFAFSVLLILTLTNCYSPIEQPENLISEQKMEVIIADILLYRQSSVLPYEVRGGNLDYTQINHDLLEKHNITWDEFKTSFNYYSKTGEQFSEMLESVKESLTELKPADSLVEKAQRIEDQKKKVEREKKRREKINQPKQFPKLKQIKEDTLIITNQAPSAKPNRSINVSTELKAVKLDIPEHED